MLKILVIKLLNTFVDIKVNWCHNLKSAFLVVFCFKQIRWVTFINKC